MTPRRPGDRWVENAIPPSGRRSTDHATRKDIAEKYEAGGTIREISAELGVSSATVYNVLRDSGVAMRPTGRRPKESS